MCLEGQACRIDTGNHTRRSLSIPSRTLGRCYPLRRQVKNCHMGQSNPLSTPAKLELASLRRTSHTTIGINMKVSIIHQHKERIQALKFKASMLKMEKETNSQSQGQCRTTCSIPTRVLRKVMGATLTPKFKAILDCIPNFHQSTSSTTKQALRPARKRIISITICNLKSQGRF